MNYFDLHCDTISEGYNQKVDLAKSHLQISLDKTHNIQKWVQTYAIWIDDALRNEAAYDYFNAVYNYFISQLRYNKEFIRPCCSFGEMQQALEAHKSVAILAVEGSAALGGKLERVQEFYDKGVSVMTLTWNGTCEVGDGCMTPNAKGLTPFGEAVVDKMQQIGMIVDVSHLSEAGFWDVAKRMHKPFIATHSNSKAVCDVPRNLTDQQFELMVSNKSLVGMNYYPLFINGKKRASINELLPHIDHFLELGGEDIIAMGSDFDGAKMCKDLKNIGQITRLEKLLVKRYGKERTEKFMFENAWEFCRKNLI